MKRLLQIAFASLVSCSLPLLATELRTDWIEPVEGFSEKSLGAQIRSIESAPADEGGTRVTIAIPKGSVANAEDIEEVIVLGRKPDKTEPTLDISHEWVADYDRDYYGLVLYLGKNGNIPLRLYFKGQDRP